MTVVSPGTQKRDFTYINDVVSANICAMNSIIPFNIYNVGTGKNFSILEIADMIGGPVRIIPERPAEVSETLADIEATTQDLGWVPKYSLEKMINSY